MNNDSQQIIKELCEQANKVGQYFNHQYAHDCFCIVPHGMTSVEYNKHFQFEDKILDFIKVAIHEKMERDGKPKDKWEDL